MDAGAGDDRSIVEEAFEIAGPDRPGPVVVLCDHASNRVPPEVAGGDLGLPPAEMSRHIAWDIGAAGVARHLGARLGAPVVLSRFSRLVIDPNRGEDDPTLVMRIYDRTIVPANRNVDAAEIARRLERWHRPYHAAIEELLAQRPDAVLISVHSFTPQLRGRPPRPWHLGVLHSGDTRVAGPLIAALRRLPDTVVGENEPYSGHLPGDSLDRHGLQKGRPHALVEIRHDLIEDPAGQRCWAERLADAIRETLDRAGLARATA